MLNSKSKSRLSCLLPQNLKQYKREKKKIEKMEKKTCKVYLRLFNVYMIHRGTEFGGRIYEEKVLQLYRN